MEYRVNRIVDGQTTNELRELGGLSELSELSEISKMRELISDPALSTRVKQVYLSHTCTETRNLVSLDVQK